MARWNAIIARACTDRVSVTVRVLAPQALRPGEIRVRYRTLDSLAIALSADCDPDDASSLSGLPASVLGALGEFVGRAVPISRVPNRYADRAAWLTGGLLRLRPSDFRHPRKAQGRLWTAGQASLPMILARDRITRRRLVAAGALDGLVQYVGEYPAPAGLRMVTYQDSTLLQALRAYPWPDFRGLTARDIDRWQRRQRAAYASAVACAAATHWVAQSLATDYGVSAAKIHVVGIGANHVVDGRGLERDWSRPRFLFVGLDWERKNGPAVLDAFARLHDEIPEATLDVVGGHPRLDHPGVRGHGVLRLQDPSDRYRMEHLYRSATAFVMPSLHEPAGSVYIEAATAGIPSIGSSNGGAATCIGDTGCLVDPASPHQLLDAMRKFAIPTVAQALGKRARERAALFTWRLVAERLVRALRLPDVDDSSLADFLPDLEAPQIASLQRCAPND